MLNTAAASATPTLPLDTPTIPPSQSPTTPQEKHTGKNANIVETDHGSTVNLIVHQRNISPRLGNHQANRKHNMAISKQLGSTAAAAAP